MEYTSIPLDFELSHSLVNVMFSVLDPKRSLNVFAELACLLVKADLGHTECSVPDDHNKVNISIKGVTLNFWFPSAYKSELYTIL